MGLYERLLGLEPFKIPVHQFQALCGEFARGTMTGQQAQDAMAALSGQALTPSEVTEVQTLLATVTGSAVAKLARVKVIDDVLMLAETFISLYDTPAKVKARLGV